jgi:hypothetical protein
MGNCEPRAGVVAAAEMQAAKAVATTEMHAAKAMPSAMTTAEMSATAVTTATVSAASRQRRTRQHGRDNQNGNSNAGPRHVMCSSLIAYSNDAGGSRKFPAPKSAEGPSQTLGSPPMSPDLPAGAE